jgi:arylsulfatase
VNSIPLLPEYGFGRGFQLYDYYTAGLVTDGLLDPQSRKVGQARTVTSNLITQSARAWLRNERRNPFFLFLHYYDVHNDYIPPAQYRNLFAPDPNGKMDGSIPSEPGQHLSERDREHLMALYDGEIAWLDHHLGILFEEIGGLGLTESTVIIVFADHGEGFDDHGYYDHGNTVYEELVRVPLFIYWPSKYPQPQKCVVPVTLMQMRETLRSIARLSKADESIPTLFESLSDISGSTAPIIGGSLDVGNPSAFVRRGSYKLIFTEETRAFEMYNLETDPKELKNLFGTDQRLCDELVDLLKGEILEQSVTDADGKVRLPQEKIDALRSLGYL